MKPLQSPTFLATAALVVALLALAPGPALAGKRVRGIDVSRFQERIHWKRVGESELRFAFVQASRGSGDDCTVVPDRCGADEYYARNYRRARAIGLRVGAYHRAFATGKSRGGARRDARAEAKRFVRKVDRLREGDLRPVLDVETPFGGLNERRLRIWVRTWLDRVRNRLGKKPIIYTNHSSWQATGDTRRFARDGHPLWVANFDVRRPLVPAGNWNGESWSIWQYTSSGKVAGIRGPVDKNRLRKGLRLRKLSVR